MINMTQAVLEGAAQHGRDGKGKDGLKGYLAWLEQKHPEQYAKLMAKWSAANDR
jgi:hypothetical protein